MRGRQNRRDRKQGRRRNLTQTLGTTLEWESIDRRAEVEHFNHRFESPACLRLIVLDYASLGLTTMATTNSGKVIISCAITGSIHTPTMSDALPITPDEIASQAIEAAEAGAAILHLHARDPKDGRPTPDAAVYMRFLPRIKQATDAVVNITTGGSVHMSLQERLAAPLLAKPEMCSLNMGTMNFGIFPLADRYTSWPGLGAAIPARERRFHLPQYISRYRAYPQNARRGARHALRTRMLRYRAPLQSGSLRRQKAR
jgi:hypothetical protein